MVDNFHSSQPIYEQLAERIKKQIIRGEVAPGDKLLSVRELGIQVNVNPNTVQRTYRELEAMKIVESKRGQGTFVTEDHSILESIREQMKESVMNDFLTEMQDMGYSPEEIKRGIVSFLDKGGDDNQ